eukprot:CAMPEP_0115405146 /NCGR_PEP_ID=MMETSP0271-20121206/17781_1 /TAXON_ID=71861 /ORGANISM="Scrippsiella trochoidea, Strain CCMP3099" /LENGTH=180 /DNA_ID=CAMNT_0002829139 /DNA_START=125 /DNA_END=667 /DNA_ORIENTATION=-
MAASCRTMLFAAVALGALCATSLAVDPDALAAEDECPLGDEECSLSLRQLRGELQAAEVQAHAEAAVAVEDTQATGTDGEDMEEVSEGHACKGKPWRTDLNNRMYQCGMASGGQTAGAASCMSKYVGEACGLCMGEMVHCGMNCISECCVGKCPTSAACVKCNKDKCYGSFYACSGEWPR